LAKSLGRPRRIGYLDLVALSYACKINGFDELVMTKFDVLKEAGFKTIKVRTASCGDENGWNPLSVSIKDDFRDLIKVVENEVGVPVTMVSTGAERGNIIHLHGDI
jgi:adenylosuccinate synthase